MKTLYVLILLTLLANSVSAAEAAQVTSTLKTFPTFEIDDIAVPYVPVPDELMKLTPLGKDNKAVLEKYQTPFYPPKGVMIYYEFIKGQFGGNSAQAINEPIGYTFTKRRQIEGDGTFECYCEDRIVADPLPLGIVCRRLFMRYKPVFQRFDYLDLEFKGLQLLLNHGANPNLLKESVIKGVKCATPLGYLCSSGKCSAYFLDVLRLLVKHKANPNLGIFNYSSPFLLEGQEEAIATVAHMPPLALLIEHFDTSCLTKEAIITGLAVLMAHGARTDLVEKLNLRASILEGYRQVVNSDQFKTLLEQEKSALT